MRTLGSVLRTVRAIPSDGFTGEKPTHASARAHTPETSRASSPHSPSLHRQVSERPFWSGSVLCGAGSGEGTDGLPGVQKHHCRCEPHLVTRLCAPQPRPRAPHRPVRCLRTRHRQEQPGKLARAGGFSRDEQFPEHAAEVLKAKTHVASAAGPHATRRACAHRRARAPSGRQPAPVPPDGIPAARPGRRPPKLRCPHLQSHTQTETTREGRAAHSPGGGQKRQEETTGPRGRKDGCSELAVRTADAACPLRLAVPPRPRAAQGPQSRWQHRHLPVSPWRSFSRHSSVHLAARRGPPPRGRPADQHHRHWPVQTAPF